MRRWLFVFFFSAFAVSGAPAHALLCTPILGCSCTVSATPMTFNNVNPFTSQATTTGSVNVDCTGVIDVAPTISVKLDRGIWGAFSMRAMRSPAGDTLNYNLFTTNAVSPPVWGDGTAGALPVVISGGLIAIQHWSVSHTVYATAYPTITTRPATYSDTVVVRIDW